MLAFLNSILLLPNTIRGKGDVSPYELENSSVGVVVILIIVVVVVVDVAVVVVMVLVVM